MRLFLFVVCFVFRFYLGRIGDSYTLVESKLWMTSCLNVKRLDMTDRLVQLTSSHGDCEVSIGLNKASQY